MAEDVQVKDDPCNSCCQTWKEKYTKLKGRCSKYESGRNALREAISVLEQQIRNLQGENLGLKKACDDERARAGSEKEDRGKESATLENEVSTLKSEILLLREKGRLVGKDADQEVVSLQLRISVAETEIIELKGLLQEERKRVAEEKEKVEMERKKAEKALEKVKAEKKRALEEKRVTDIERKRGQEFKLQYETLKCEADEAKSKLSLEAAKYEEEMKKLKAEREISKQQREHVDKEMAKAEDLLKLAEANWKKAMDERNRADRLSQQLDQSKKRLDQSEKEFLEHPSSRKLVEIPCGQPVREGHSELSGKVCPGIRSRETNALEKCKKHEELEKKLLKVKKQVKSEMKKAEEQMRFAEAYKSKAMEEKSHADHLSCELDGNKQWLENIHNEIQELVSSVEVFQSYDPAFGGNLQEATAEIKLLRKKLKFEKMRVKHANEVSKMEMNRNQILRQEMHRLKQEFLQFSQRFDLLDKCLFVKSSEGTNDKDKIGRLILEQEHFHVQPSMMIPHTENESLKPSCAHGVSRGGSNPVKQNKKPTVLLPPVSVEICTSPVTGTDSSLELLVRGSNSKMLHNSAINSCSASFSDRPLVGSQEKGTFSVATSALLAEEQNLGPTTFSLSEDARKGYDEKLRIGAENSVGSLMTSSGTEISGRHRKRKRFPDEVESIKRLYSAGQRWHQQVLQKLSVLHGMSNGESLKCLEDKRSLVPEVQGNVCSKLFRPHKRKNTLNIGVEMLHASELKTKLETQCTEISKICKNVITTKSNADALKFRDIRNDVLGTSWQLPMDLEVLGQDYKKIVDLDYDEDEKYFRKAVEEPLSPLSPTLRNVQFPCTEAAEIDMHSSWSSPRQDNAIPSCSFDVINMEIDSNKRTLESLGSYQNSSFGTCKPQNDSKKTFDNSGSGDSDAIVGFAGQFQNSSLLLVSPGDEDLTCECKVSAFTRFPQYCVVSSNNIECSSIHRIFHACSVFMSQFSGSCSIERLIQKILLSLQKADGLPAGERVSIFLSLLLHYLGDISIPMSDFRIFLDANSLQLMNAFSQQWHTVLNDVTTKRMFESCDVNELLALIEDFLLNRTILVYGDVSQTMMRGYDSGAKAVSDKCRFWSSAAASTDLLFTGGLLLASICVSVDQIGLICEISYNLFSSRKINISFLLKLFHVFAYLCGPKYFTIEDYCLEMCVLKCLVVFLEKMDSSSTDKFSCLHSMEKLVKISEHDSTCPFLEGAESVDMVVSLLLGKLDSYVLSGTENQAQLSSNNAPEFHGMKAMSSADAQCHTKAVQLNFSAHHLCCFIDILSLVELVASFMTWDWIFGNIISRLFKILDSYIPGDIFPAVIALLGQLGRIGVDAKGYEDSEVDCLRNWLVGFLCRNTFRSYGLSSQFASVIALIGLVASSFEEVIESTVDRTPSGSQSVAVDCVSKWFCSLTKEEQSSFRSLHSGN